MPFVTRCEARLKNFPDLTTMNLSGTIASYSDTKDLEEMVVVLNEHPEIKRLELQSCNLHDHHLPFLLRQLKYIESINLRGNYITINGLHLFLEILKDNKEINIKEVDLRNSNFSDNSEAWDRVITLIPDSVVRLNLDGNRAILGDIKDKIATKIQGNIEKQRISKKVESLSSSSYSPAFYSSPSLAFENQKENSESPSLSPSHLNIK